MIRKMIGFIIIFAMALVIIPEMASAQNRSYGGYGRQYDGRFNPIYRGRTGYGYYDPAYLQQMMSLPEGLAACSVDFSTGRVVSCHPVVKEIGAIQAYLQNPGDSLFGTVHVEKGKLHFRPFDDTNQRLGRGGAVAIGTTGGAVAGAVFGGKKGAVIGGGTGVLAGWLASRKFNRHDNCLVIEPTVAQSSGLTASSSETAAIPTVAPSVEQVVAVQPIAGPAVSGSGEGEFELSNGTRFRLEVYYDGKYIGRMGRPGQDPGAGPLHVSYPETGKVYEAHMLVPNEEGGISSRPAKRVPGDVGLTFSEPEAARGR